jgi:hypothetical protein
MRPFSEIVNPALIDSSPPDPSGYPAELAVRDTEDNLRMLGARDFPDSLWIEPREWGEWAQRNDEQKLWATNLRNRWTNQSGTHECTCHSLIQCAESAWNATAGGKDHAVLFSQIGIYAEANPGQRGGAYVQQVLSIAMNRGFIPERIRGQENRFKHTLHGTCGRGNADNSSGPWVPLNRFPEGWQQTARHFRPRLVINPTSVEQMVCLLLRRRRIGVGRDGHAVPLGRVLWQGGFDRNNPLKNILAGYCDSYDVERFDSLTRMRKSVSGSFCIWEMHVPDDWSKPAGADMKS